MPPYAKLGTTLCALMLARTVEEIDAAAMRLMLLRHAKADKAEAGMRDRDRRLNGRGRDDAARIAAHMARHALLPDRVIVSTAQRTRETWERMAGAFSTGLAVGYEDRLYDAGTEGILAVIKAADRSASALMVIAHNPGMYATARLLLAHRGGEAHQLDDGLPTSGLVVIDFAENDWRKVSPRSGRLKEFVTPGLLRAAKD
jgi:phosphohistidine phosphatase